MKEKIKTFFKEINQNIFVGERLKRNLLGITLVSILCVVFGIVMITINIIQKSGFVIYSSVLFIAGGGASAISSGIFKCRKVSVIIALSVSVVVFTYYLVSGAMHGFSIVWALIMPIGVSYFLSVRLGIIMSSYYELLCITLFYTPLRQYMAPMYSEEMMTRYPIIFLVLSLFILVSMVQFHRMALRDIAYTERLNEEVKVQTAIACERASRLEAISGEMVKMLALSIDAKDRYTNGHSFRVAEYSTLLAKKLDYSEEEVEILWREALLHDIGKIGIPDAVLNKPGKLTKNEFDIIKAHTTIGGKILSKSNDLSSAADVAKYHHERYDGSGYPFGLSGKDIPIHARIVTIADAYDAMKSDRIYRSGLDNDKIREELISGRGTQFDPEFLDTFIVLHDTGLLEDISNNTNPLIEHSVDFEFND